MREIEIKAKVSSKSDLINAITTSGMQLSSPITQHDVVYGRIGIADNAPGSIWLRVRTENDSKSIFTLKQQHKSGLDSIEHETIIEDADEMSRIISLLGYELYSDLTKTRQKAMCNGIEICLDDVDNLGVFIEAEKLIDIDADDDGVVEELWSELTKLGIDRSEEVFEGYDVLLNRQNALK